MSLTPKFWVLFCLLSIVPLSDLRAQAAKDAQSLTILAQMVQATGWASTAQLQDIKALGMVTRYQGVPETPIAITLESKGPRLFRTDVQDPSGTVTTLVNGDAAVIMTPSTTTFLPFYAAVAIRPIVFPFLGGALAFMSDNCSVQYEGIESVAGQQAYRIELSIQAATTADAASLLRAKASDLIVWISVSTALPVQVQYSRPSSSDPRTTRQITNTLSDYRVVAGIQIPFHQEEYASGQQLLSLQLDTVVVNTGVPVSDFSPATVAN
jgi:outer membrane lipoprotein-sorting protein